MIESIRRRTFAERYLATAALVWAVYGSLSAVLLHTTLPTWAAGGLAYSVALVIHFTLHRFVVFRHAELAYRHEVGAQAMRYLATAAAQYGFTLFGTAFLVDHTSLHRSVAYLSCALFAAVLNFLGLKFVVFRHRAEAPLGEPLADGSPRS